MGGEAFVRRIKERLGIRAKGRKVVRGESRFELREISAPYVDVFGGEEKEWGHPLKGPCQEEKLILCEKIYFLAKLQYGEKESNKWMQIEKHRR